ncbi:MAG: hypothetical protein LBV43_06660 [Prevotella sp.]|jgi:hypothetical protein|nr:hypothetical protein [Prevotella sp.]
MPYYTLSDCVLRKGSTEKKYVANLLWTFVQENNPYKVVLDSGGSIIDIYNEIGENDPIIATWLRFMSDNPSNFEPIDIDLNGKQNNEEIFLSVCSSTAIQKKIIVFSHQGWKHYTYSAGNTIIYEGVPIQVLNGDEAILEMQPRNLIKAENSIVVTSGGTVSGSGINVEN